MESVMNLLKLKAFVFDFDGTLAVLNIDFSLMRDRVLELIDRFGVERESVKERYLLEVIDEVRAMILERSTPDAQQFYREAHQTLHQIEMKAAEKGKLLRGVKKTLRAVRTKGIRLGIVSRNCEEAVRKVFPGIDGFCDIFISRDSIARVKPHPEHLAAVLRALEVPARKAVMIGDHIIDIQAGRRAGMKTIGVLTGRTTRKEFEEAGADYVSRGVWEIPLLLEKFCKT